MKIELNLENDGVELDIILMPNGIAKFRKNETPMACGTWEKAGNTLSIDASSLELADKSDRTLCFEITTENSV